ncbi:MAG: hypothetical protein QE274_04960, partial [Verrucomicrobiaceae bacterium]|nr:hypothetical protein [Verrucomicrobiaceae bacterium]
IGHSETPIINPPVLHMFPVPHEEPIQPSDLYRQKQRETPKANEHQSQKVGPSAPNPALADKRHGCFHLTHQQVDF